MQSHLIYRMEVHEESCEEEEEKVEKEPLTFKPNENTVKLSKVSQAFF